jgi:hypothetical protein
VPHGPGRGLRRFLGPSSRIRNARQDTPQRRRRRSKFGAAGEEDDVVEHVVLFRWKAGAAPEAIAHVIEGLRGLRNEIPGIVDLSCGENFSERSEGFHCGLVVRFADRAALDAYGPHPAHQAVVQERLLPIRDAVVVVDYEL